ncbi:MAG: DUF4376 domain-containing protein [Cyanobacteria bacterium RUI128]|nr:DUF4376 domain-containing protein [Cyanobacteria bacterium RUI128]
MSYELLKPYTVPEKVDFISFHNGQNDREIFENDVALYALEPDEMVKNGEIVVNPDYDKEVLGRAKADKIEENDTLRDTALLGGVTYNNVLFDSDTDQKTNLIGTIMLMSDTDTVVWYGMDNQGLLCTKADLMEIGGLITELHSFCWQNNAFIKEQIEQAGSIADLENIEIKYMEADDEDS